MTSLCHIQLPLNIPVKVRFARSAVSHEMRFQGQPLRPGGKFCDATEAGQAWAGREGGMFALLQGLRDNRKGLSFITRC